MINRILPILGGGILLIVSLTVATLVVVKMWTERGI